MPDWLAALVVIAALTSPYWVPRLRIWSRCRCGTWYCNGCRRPR